MDYRDIRYCIKILGETLTEASLIVLVAAIIRIIVTLSFGPIVGKTVTYVYIVGKIIVALLQDNGYRNSDRSPY